MASPDLIQEVSSLTIWRLNLVFVSSLEDLTGNSRGLLRNFTSSLKPTIATVDEKVVFSMYGNVVTGYTPFVVADKSSRDKMGILLGDIQVGLTEVKDGCIGVDVSMYGGSILVRECPALIKVFMDFDPPGLGYALIVVACSDGAFPLMGLRGSFVVHEPRKWRAQTGNDDEEVTISADVVSPGFFDMEGVNYVVENRFDLDFIWDSSTWSEFWNGVLPFKLVRIGDVDVFDSLPKRTIDMLEPTLGEETNYVSFVHYVEDLSVKSISLQLDFIMNVDLFMNFDLFFALWPKSYMEVGLFDGNRIYNKVSEEHKVFDDSPVCPLNAEDVERVLNSYAKDGCIGGFIVLKDYTLLVRDDSIWHLLVQPVVTWGFTDGLRVFFVEDIFILMIGEVLLVAYLKYEMVLEHSPLLVSLGVKGVDNVEDMDYSSLNMHSLNEMINLGSGMAVGIVLRGVVQYREVFRMPMLGLIISGDEKYFSDVVGYCYVGINGVCHIKVWLIILNDVILREVLPTLYHLMFALLIGDYDVFEMEKLVENMSWVISDHGRAQRNLGWDFHHIRVVFSVYTETQQGRRLATSSIHVGLLLLKKSWASRIWDEELQLLVLICSNPCGDIDSCMSFGGFNSTYGPAGGTSYDGCYKVDLNNVWDYDDRRDGPQGHVHCLACQIKEVEPVCMYTPWLDIRKIKRGMQGQLDSKNADSYFGVCYYVVKCCCRWAGWLVTSFSGSRLVPNILNLGIMLMGSLFEDPIGYFGPNLWYFVSVVPFGIKF